MDRKITKCVRYPSATTLAQEFTNKEIDPLFFELPASVEIFAKNVPSKSLIAG
jgi:hypothetical protein